LEGPSPGFGSSFATSGRTAALPSAAANAPSPAVTPSAVA
jgi:hypothetical protein